MAIQRKDQLLFLLIFLLDGMLKREMSMEEGLNLICWLASYSEALLIGIHVSVELID
jgi:hypothetical protein